MTTKDDVKLAWLSYDLAWERWQEKKITEEEMERILLYCMSVQERFNEQEEQAKEERAKLHKGDN